MLIFKKFPLWFTLSLMDYLKVYYLVSKCLEIFLLSYWYRVWFHCGHRTYSMISIFWIYWGLFYGPEYNLSWYMFCGDLKEGRYILVFGGLFYLPTRFCWLMVVLITFISLLICCVVILSIVERGLLKSPAVIVDFFSLFCFVFILLW